MIILHSTAVLGPFRDRCVRIIYGQTKSESGKFPSDLHWEKQNILILLQKAPKLVRFKKDLEKKIKIV